MILIFIIQPNFVIENIVFRLCIFIINIFFEILDILKNFLIYCHKIHQIIHQLFSWFRLWLRINIFFIRYTKAKAIIELKRYVTSANVFYIVIDKFSYWKKFCLAILFKIDKNLEVTFYCTTLHFSLVVNLRVKSNKKFLLNT